MEVTKAKKRFSVLDMTLCALFAALMAVCAWISIPTPWDVSFTMQTFAIFAAFGLLGGKRGTIALAVYLVLGAVGLPVFSNFRGGVGVLLGTTGGYIMGFVLSALAYWLLTAWLGEKFWVQLLAMVLGCVLCYGAGTAWYMAVYTQTKGAVALGTVLGWCVVPYLIPDAVKIALALGVTKSLKRFVP